MSQGLVRTSTVKVDSNSWAKLLPLSALLSSYDIAENLVIIGRYPTCTIQINDRRLSGKHCQIHKKDNDSITITDLSTNGTFLKDERMRKGEEVELLDGQ